MGLGVFQDYLGFCCHLLAERQEAPAGLGGAWFLCGSSMVPARFLRLAWKAAWGRAGAGLWGFAGFQQQGGSVLMVRVAFVAVQK